MREEDPLGLSVISFPSSFTIEALISEDLATPTSALDSLPGPSNEILTGGFEPFVEPEMVLPFEEGTLVVPVYLPSNAWVCSSLSLLEEPEVLATGFPDLPSSFTGSCFEGFASELAGTERFAEVLN